MNVFFARCFQSVMYLAMFFLPWREPKLISGKGSFAALPKRVKDDNVSRVLVITDKGLMNLKMLEPLFEALTAEGVFYVLYDEVVANPTIANVEAALKLYKDNKCEAIIAVGGGSPMDAAKGTGARVANPKKSIEKMRGILKVGRKLPKIYAVPTTSGTGSETTLAAVITNGETHHKFAMNDPALIPYAAVLDPLLTVKLPKKITSTTGMDALCHATESYIGRENTAATKKYAKEAILLIRDNLVKAYENGEDVVARENMQHASYLAGLAFTRAYVGYVHAIAHSLGGKYGIPHGLANAVIMPYVFEAYGKKAYKKLAELADLIEITDSADTEEIKAKKYIEWIREMNRKMEIPDGFSEIKLEDIDEMSAHAEKEGNPLYPVPRVMSQNELKEIYGELILE